MALLSRLSPKTDVIAVYHVWQGSLPFSVRPPLLSKVIDKVGTYYEFGWDGMVPRLDEVDAEDIRVNLKVQTRMETVEEPPQYKRLFFHLAFFAQLSKSAKRENSNKVRDVIPQSTAKGEKQDP